MWKCDLIQCFSNQELSFEAGVSSLDFWDALRIFREMVYLLKHNDCDKQKIADYFIYYAL